MVLLPNKQLQAPHHVTVDLGQLTGGTRPPKIRASDLSRAMARLKGVQPVSVDEQIRTTTLKRLILQHGASRGWQRE